MVAFLMGCVLAIGAVDDRVAAGPVVPLIQALKQRNVQVGRLFPALPDYMRVTIGKKAEMETFLSAFRQVAA